MTVYRYSCVEAPTNLVLFREESSELQPLIARFEEPLDKAYLMKVAKEHTKAEGVVVTVEERTETSDWREIRHSYEFLY